MSNSPATLEASVVRNPAIRGGEPILAGTSTPVRALAELWNQGMAAEEIPMHLPHLKLEQVFAGLHYYLSHREEIDQLIAANEIPESWSGRRFDPATGQVR